jgi:hypothetical protein
LNGADRAGLAAKNSADFDVGQSGEAKFQDLPLVGRQLRNKRERAVLTVRGNGDLVERRPRIGNVEREIERCVGVTCTGPYTVGNFVMSNGEQPGPKGALSGFAAGLKSLSSGNGVGEDLLSGVFRLLPCSEPVVGRWRNRRRQPLPRPRVAPRSVSSLPGAPQSPVPDFVLLLGRTPDRGKCYG